MTSPAEDRWSFICEFYDPLASIIRKYQLIYHAADNSVEMYDIKTKKTFLKRTVVPDLRPEDIFIGATVTIFSRQLQITDFGDAYTKTRMEGFREQTLALIKQDALVHMGKIIDRIFSEGFRVFKMKMLRLSNRDRDDFAAISKRTTAEIPEVVLALVLETQQCVKKWKEVMGPPSPAEARKTTLDTLRSLYGTDNNRNAVHGSDSNHDAKDEISFFFGNKRFFTTTATFSDCTTCIIKPHAFLTGKAGQIIDAIQEAGWVITCLESFKLEQEDAAEFLEVYKGVVPEYPDMVAELTSGPCVAMELRRNPNRPASASTRDLDVVQAFRQFAGPYDPQVARVLRPDTLRSRFGVDKIKNAVHCTDLSDDGVLETEYFFKILQ